MTKLVIQAQVAAISYLVVAFALSMIPLKVNGEVLFDTNAAKWMSILSFAVGAAITTAAIQCSVVGKCNKLAWVYTIVLAAGSFVLAISAFAVTLMHRQLKKSNSNR